MRRGRLSVALTNVDWVESELPPEQPYLSITFDGPEEELKERFRKSKDSGYTPDDLDFCYRIQQSSHPTVSGGVFSVSDRLTGEYLFEIDVSVKTIEKFVYAVRRYATTRDEETRYGVEIRVGNRPVAEFGKEIFLVYGSERTLLRHRSLIPDEIEI